MIVASHQPNFLPYPGFFFKMYCADIFTLSDTVKFSSTGYHNYNYLMENGRRVKITVPVKSHTLPIMDVELADWHYYREKIINRLWQDYHNAPFYRKCADMIVDVFRRDYRYMEHLNTELIQAIMMRMHMDVTIRRESNLDLHSGTPTDQIMEICTKLGADTYLSGDGAKEYLNVDELEKNHIVVAWSNYKSIDNGQNISMLDYLMNNGFVIPDDWKRKKEAMRRGTRL